MSVILMISKKKITLSLLICLICFALIIIPVNGALQSNRLMFFPPGKYLEYFHGPGQNYTWTINGRSYGDFSGKVSWYEVGYVISEVGEFPKYGGWVNGTLEADNGTIYTYELGNKSGEPYTYQVLSSSNAAECRQDRSQCNNRIYRVRGEFYINGEYQKYFDEYGFASGTQYTLFY